MQSNKIDIQDLTVEELQNLQQEAKQLIETKKEENITQAYEQILKLHEQNQWMKSGNAPRSKAPASSSASSTPKPASASAATAASTKSPAGRA